jgi:cytochrome c oxidase cbb3-type subunit 4
MDINDFRAWHTLILLLSFVGIVWWAYGKHRKAPFDEAANLPFADDDTHQATMEKENKA